MVKIPGSPGGGGGGAHCGLGNMILHATQCGQNKKKDVGPGRNGFSFEVSHRTMSRCLVLALGEL